MAAWSLLLRAGAVKSAAQKVGGSLLRLLGFGGGKKAAQAAATTALSTTLANSAGLPAGFSAGGSKIGTWLSRHAITVGSFFMFDTVFGWLNNLFTGGKDDDAVFDLVSDSLEGLEGGIRVGVLANQSRFEQPVNILNLEIWQCFHTLLPTLGTGATLRGYTPLASHLRRQGWNAGVQNTPPTVEMLNGLLYILSPSALTSFNILSALNIPDVYVLKAGGLTIAFMMSDEDRKHTRTFDKTMKVLSQKKAVSDFLLLHRVGSSVEVIFYDANAEVENVLHVPFGYTFEYFGGLFLHGLVTKRLYGASEVEQIGGCFLPLRSSDAPFLGDGVEGNTLVTYDMHLDLDQLGRGQDLILDMGVHLGKMPPLKLGKVPVTDVAVLPAFFKEFF